MLGMQRKGITSYRALEKCTGVPSSTLHAYVRGTTNVPDEDNLLRIAAAFGDPPEVIHKLRTESPMPPRESSEHLTALIRTSVLDAMETQGKFAAERQAEIIRHADERIALNEQRCAERIRATDERCAERIADLRAHYEELLASERERRAEMDQRYTSNRDYLKSLVRNLSGTLVVVALYALYAYQVFDRSDPTRGLYRKYGGDVIPLVILLLLIALVGRKVLLLVQAKAAEEKKNVEK